MDDESHCHSHSSSVKLCFCVCVGKKPAANDLFGEADDISSDSDAEKPPTPGQPMVRHLHTQPQNFHFLNAETSQTKVFIFAPRVLRHEDFILTYSRFYAVIVVLFFLHCYAWYYYYQSGRKRAKETDQATDDLSTRTSNVY